MPQHLNRSLLIRLDVALAHIPAVRGGVPSAVNFYKRNLGDIAKDLADFDALQMGMFDLLADFYYANERPLPNDITVLSRVARLRSKRWLDVLVGVLDRCFPVGPDGLRHNKRADHEIAKYLAQSQTNSGNIKKRWEDEKAKENKEGKIRPVYDSNQFRNTTPESRIQNPASSSSESKDSSSSEVFGLIPEPPPPKRKKLTNGMAGAERVIAFMNSTLGTNFSAAWPNGKPTDNGKIIKARLDSGVTEAQLMGVFKTQADKWYGDPKMQEYLRPETLFGAKKLSGYIGQIAKEYLP